MAVIEEPEIFGDPIFMELTWGSLIPAIGVIITAGGVYLAWRSARERQLRLDDVLEGSNEVIRSMQALYLMLLVGDRSFEAGEIAAALKKIIVDTSVLVEQGRMYFKNEPDPVHGKEKPEAYRGYRAEILDPIVVAHQIACQWETADESKRRRMTLVAEDCVRRFVSMAQKEVGRGETQSREMAKGGKGDTLELLMKDLSPDRLERIGKRAKKTTQA